MSAHIRGSGPREKMPDYVVKRLAMDKLGIFSGEVIRHHRIGAVNQIVNPLWLATPPDPFNGLPCVGASSDVEKGFCVITFRYDGTPGGESTYTFGEDQTEYELDTTMTEEPIETHPAWQLLKKLYGWNDGTRRFSELMPEQADTRQGALAGAKQATKANPLFGIDSWLAIGATFKMTKAYKTVPQTILRGIGTIMQKPDSGSFNLPAIGKGRNWLRLAPTVVKRGNAVSVTTSAMLSGAQGWPTPIYRAGQLD